MTSSVCPACKVAVVPGYVRCPKCHTSLPRYVRSSGSPVGGTAVKMPGSSPMVAVAVGLAIAGGIVAYFSLGKGRPPPVASGPQAVANVAGQEESTSTTSSQPPPPVPSQQTKPPAPEPVAAELERSLRRARLWSTVTVVGERVDVRSGSCGEPQMKSALDTSASAFKAAGLTKLRCIEQSGTVVFTREL